MVLLITVIRSYVFVNYENPAQIFLRPKDEIGVILMGSDGSKSDSITGLDNAQELCSMQVGNWDLIKSIEKLQTTDQTCSWMEAIYAAIEYVKHECM